jgi:hypothetical protein
MKRRKRYSPGEAGMAEIMGEAAARDFYLVAPGEMRGLRIEEIRQLHIARLQQQQRSSKAGGAPTKLPRAAKAEIKRRIADGETKIPTTMHAKYPMIPLRSWRRYVSTLRGGQNPDKASKPTSQK